MSSPSGLSGPVPVGSKVLRFNFESGVVFSQRPQPHRKLADQVLLAGHSVSLTLTHFFEVATALPDQVLTVIARVLLDGPLTVVKCKLNLFVIWRKWLRSWRGKSLDWPDEHLHHDLTHGFHLVGEEKLSGVFPLDSKPTELTVDGLMEQAS